MHKLNNSRRYPENKGPREEIFFSGVNGGPFTDFEFTIPHSAFTVIAGATGTGKSILLRAIGQESSRRMFAKVVRYSPRFPLGAPRLAWREMRGMLPAIHLNERIELLPHSVTLAQYLDLDRQLIEVIVDRGSPLCANCGGTLTDISMPAVIREITDSLSSHGSSAVFAFSSPLHTRDASHTSQMERGDLTELVLTYLSLGHRRFIVGDQVVRLPPMEIGSNPVDAGAPLLSRISSESDLYIIADSLTLGGDGEVFEADVLNRFSEAVDAARDLGGEIVTIFELTRDGLSATRHWHCAALNYCPRCDEVRPRLGTSLFYGRHCQLCGGSGQLAREAPIRRCEECEGTGFGPDARSATLQGRNVAQLFSLTIDELHELLQSHRETHRGAAKLCAQLASIQKIGLGSTQLIRLVEELSSGEQLKAALLAIALSDPVETLILADDLQRLLHPLDGELVFGALRELVQRDNTVVVTAASRADAVAADNVIELRSPVNYSATVSDSEPPKRKSARRAERGPLLRVHFPGGGVAEIPGGVVVALAGVAGSGKSRLFEGIAAEFDGGGVATAADGCQVQLISAKDVTLVAGRGTRTASTETLASALRVEEPIARLFASLPGARQAGLTAAHFMLQRQAGRCEACRGTGVQLVDLETLGLAYERCATCDGARFTPRVQKVLYQGLSIVEIVRQTVASALAIFAAHEQVVRALTTAQELALAHLQLGSIVDGLPTQELQRVRLAALAIQRRRQERLLLLEQPFSSLGGEELGLAMRVVRSIALKNASVIFSTHDPDAMVASDLTMVLGRDGSLAYYGDSFRQALAHWR